MGPCRPGRVAAFVLGMSLAVPATAEVGPHALINVSQELLRIYNTEDAQALHGLLAPSLQANYPVETLRRVVAHCRVLTHDIFRFSTPSWGARRFGFFAVYTETSVFEMILEIDENEKIVHWVVTDNVTSSNQQCTVNNLQ
jgi:hypothetical protein